MTARMFAALVAFVAVLSAAVAPIGGQASRSTSVHAQDPQGPQPQIPSLQVCNQTTARGAGLVKIASRSDAIHTGTFVVRIDLTCDPAGTGYPAGTLTIERINMSDSIVQGTIKATTFEQVTSTGKHTPTVYLNGRCAVAPSGQGTSVAGCRYWLMIADNRPGPSASGTPDIVSFLAFNGLGMRIAYGTGPLVEGDIKVAPTGN